MKIEQLAPQVAAQIAAGEVVERPASVVKELVENSIDADATRITVEIKGGGVEQIRVSDNGSGIPADELSLAFQRHTTSKLRNAEDLQTITTLGFRGEALPSIASVSIVECHSKTPDAPAGTQIRLQHGRMQGPPQAYGCPVGTTFQVSDLFGNTPVRRKFLRTRNTELNHIQQAVARYAMARPSIKFLLTTDSRNAMETPGSDRLTETILALYDRETAENMLELSLEREDIRISGYTANREAHRGSRSEITTLVNGRWVRDSNLAYAVEQAYDKTLPPHRHPISVINIDIPGHLVDINAHPTKQEVRFKSSNKVFGAVRQAVEQALREHSPIHRIQPTLRSQGQTFPRSSPPEAGNGNPARQEPGPSLKPRESPNRNPHQEGTEPKLENSGIRIPGKTAGPGTCNSTHLARHPIRPVAGKNGARPDPQHHPGATQGPGTERQHVYRRRPPPRTLPAGPTRRPRAGDFTTTSKQPPRRVPPRRRECWSP